MSEQGQSPPFRDSDAIYIVAKRMERMADAMTSHDYSNVEADMNEIQEWLDWLASVIASRDTPHPVRRTSGPDKESTQ